IAQSAAWRRRRVDVRHLATAISLLAHARRPGPVAPVRLALAAALLLLLAGCSAPSAPPTPTAAPPPTVAPAPAAPAAPAASPTAERQTVQDLGEDSNDVA